MKKIYIRLSAFFIAFIVAFFSIPFFNVCALSSIPSWLSAENIQYFFATQSGLVDSSNNSLQSFFENPSAQTLYDAINNAVVFVPGMGVFRLGVPDVQLEGYSKDDCDIVVNDDDTVSFSGDFVDSTLDGLGTKISSPLDGVKVYTNFNTNFDYSSSAKPLYYETVTNDIKNKYINNYDNVVFFGGFGSQNHNSNINKLNFKYYSFDLTNVDYYFFINAYDNSLNYRSAVSPRLHLHYTPSDTWYQSTNNSSIYNRCSSFFITPTSDTGSESYFYNNTTSGLLNYVSSSDFQSSTIVGTGTSFTDDIFDGFMYSNRPVVFATSFLNGKSYYYWLYGSPSGVYYNTVNFQNNYNTSYLDNNWAQTYNNYVTDVSNYYSTTENITNEQLSQYIDNSTTITNIINNYITNNNGGGSGEDDIITNSWLERIYNKLLDIISILRGQSLPDSSDHYVTDNSIKNDIVEYPLSDLFPSVPDENFLPANADFSFPLASEKVSSALFNTIPFCYLEQVKIIVGALSVPPSAPYYEIPFVIESANINESVVIDLTSDTWSTIHSVWIVLFMIGFIVALIYFTYRFIILVSSIIG